MSRDLLVQVAFYPLEKYLKFLSVAWTWDLAQLLLAGLELFTKQEGNKF